MAFYEKNFIRAILTSWVIVSSGTALLEGANTIRGRVTNAATGNAVAGADLDVIETSTNTSVPITDLAGGPAVTDASGNFAIQLPGPGTYWLRVDLDAAAPLADRYYGNTTLKSAATPIVVNSGADVTGRDIQLISGYSISGSVFGGTARLADVDLDVYEYTTGEFMGSYPGRTDASGNFTLGAFPPGQYIIKADPDPLLGQYYVYRYFGGDLDRQTATPIQITNSPVSGITITLDPGGSLSGRLISQSSGLPLEGIDLDFYTNAGVRVPFNASSGVDGIYTAGPFPAGNYIVRADPTDLQGHAEGYYTAQGAGVPTLYEQDAAPVTIVDGMQTGSIDFTLLPGSMIQGTVRAASGQSLADIDLDIYSASGRRISLTTRTNLDGSYAIGPLPGGDYLLRADPTLLQGHATAYYSTLVPNSLFSDDASAIAVTAGVNRSGIDFSLQAAGRLYGTIRDRFGNPVPGIDLDVYDFTGRRVSLTSLSALDGTYEIGPLPYGDYLLRADPGPKDGYLLNYFPGTPDAALAQSIPIRAALSAAQADFTLQPAGWLEGRVVTATGLPLEAIDIDVYDATTGARVSGNAVTDATGAYLFGPVPVGSYLVRADPTLLQGYAVSYYPGVYRQAEAAAVAVQSQSGTSGVDVALDVGGSLSGTIVDRQTGLPLSGMDIDVFDAVTGLRMDQGAITDLNGAWQVGPLPVGSYIVRGDSAAGSSLSDIYSGNSRTIDQATAFSLSAGSNTVVPAMNLPPDLVVPVIRLSPGATGWSIDFDSVTGLRYYLESSATLQPGSWQSTGQGLFDGTGSLMRLPLSLGALPSGPVVFFRVRID